VYKNLKGCLEKLQMEKLDYFIYTKVNYDVLMFSTLLLHESFIIFFPFYYTFGLVKEYPRTLFRDTKFRKYSLKKSNVTNFNALITQCFIKTYY